MRFGMFYVLESPDNDYARAYNEMFGQIEYAERLGFDSVWFAEHHGSQYGSMPSGAVAAAAAAKITQRMRIGLAVSILPFNNPVRTAEDYAMVDVISGGRLDMGVGRGYQPREFAHLGLAQQQAHSREIFEESLDILIGLWENDTFSYQGKYYRLDNVHLTPRPLQKPRPPITVAAISPSTFQLVGKYGLNVMVTPTLMSLDELKGFVLAAKKDLVAAGMHPGSLNFPMNWQVHLAPTEREALDRTSAALDWYFNLVMKLVPKGPNAQGYEYMANVAAEFEKAGGIDLKSLRDGGIIMLGTPAMMRAKLTELRNDIGLSQLFCWMRIGGLEDHKVRASMQLFAEEVMPYFRE
jgi:alkanesulfonate monooxygenase SsuD/methylene tetrahydromethanopterin reductase-like flavin-dependent oxidoreductase (luciferase family)